MRERASISFYWFIPQIGTMAGPGQNQEPEPLPASFTWVERSQTLYSAAFSGTLVGRWIVNGAARTWTSNSGGVTYCPSCETFKIDTSACISQVRIQIYRTSNVETLNFGSNCALLSVVDGIWLLTLRELWCLQLYNWWEKMLQWEIHNQNEGL